MRFDDIEGEADEAKPLRFDDIEGDVDEQKEPGAFEGGYQGARAVLGGPEGMDEGEQSAARQGVAGLLGFAQGATFNNADEAQGAIESLPYLAGDVLRGQNPLDRYRSNRDRARELHRRAKADSPWAYGGMEFAGGAAIPIPGMGKLKAGKSLLQAAKVGGALGATGMAGASEADLTRGEWGDFAKDVLGGGVFGAATGGALHGVMATPLNFIGRKAVRGLENVNEDIARKSNEELASALGRRGKQGQEATGAVENLWNAGGMAKELASGAPTPMRTIDQGHLFDRLQARVHNAREKVADFYNNPVKIPAVGDLIASNTQSARQAANERMRRGALQVPVGTGAAAVGGWPGFLVAEALVGGTPLHGARELVKGVFSHPDLLEKLVHIDRWGGIIGKAAQKGEEGLLPVLFSLYQKEPEVRDAMLDVANDLDQRNIAPLR